jgi:cell division topological specificity factor
MDFLARIFGRSKDSAGIARQRLQLVLAQDRTNISAETLNILKDEIITVISKHVEIDRANVEVTISRSNLGNRLIANIPVLGTRSQRPQPPVARATSARASSRKSR